ncbi:hypothetical protein LY78DRAFT_663187 [Colletotrichum sublineola]|nr:hypothetical protein LY78DRAFT_663187 [Colletotrichum sublineola]
MRMQTQKTLVVRQSVDQSINHTSRLVSSYREPPHQLTNGQKNLLLIPRRALPQTAYAYLKPVPSPAPNPSHPLEPPHPPIHPSISPCP